MESPNRHLQLFIHVSKYVQFRQGSSQNTFVSFVGDIPKVGAKASEDSFKPSGSRLCGGHSCFARCDDRSAPGGSTGGGAYVSLYRNHIQWITYIHSKDIGEYS